jgi:hypothetical protein
MLIIVVAAAAFIFLDILENKDYIDAFSGATPPALEKNVPDRLALTVDGKVDQIYHFNSRSFRLLAKTRIRTREVTPEGDVTGTYIYTGVPLLYIMEGVRPKKNKTDVFDRPMDIVVVITSSNGQTARFSYGELTCIDDGLPITLAYYREQLLPSKDPEKYTKNKFKGDVTGLRLVCPREPDTSRYLDDVVRITLTIPDTPNHLLPQMQKGKKCNSESVTCVDNEELQASSYDNVPVVDVSNWVRTGHGRGLKGSRPFNASGYHLPSFLKQNFPGCGPDDFFVFIACDGYRSTFSGREIFNTAAGDLMLLLNSINGEPPKGGHTIGAVSDFFVDRCVWGLSHVVRIPAVRFANRQPSRLVGL